MARKINRSLMVATLRSILESPTGSVSADLQASWDASKRGDGYEMKPFNESSLYAALATAGYVETIGRRVYLTDAGVDVVFS